MFLSVSFVPSVASSSTFTIRHFAGDVVYDIYSLLNANADTLADDIISTFNSKVGGAVQTHTHTPAAYYSYAIVVRIVNLDLLLIYLRWS